MKRKSLILLIASSLTLVIVGILIYFFLITKDDQSRIVDLESIYISDENNIEQLQSDLETTLEIDEEINPGKKGEIEFDENRKVISFTDDLSDEQKEDFEEQYSITFTEDTAVNGTYSIIIDEDSDIDSLEEENLVETIEIDIPIKMFTDTVDWGILRIGATQAWSTGTGSGITVAIIDTGIQLDHPDLSANILTGYDFVNDDSSANDDNGHGTHVAGIVASTMNSAGNVGASYSANLLPIKVLNESGYGYLSDVAKGIFYAADNGARVINMSLGTTYDSNIMRKAIQYATNKGVLIVAAAGNESGAPCSYPAAYSSVICVVATTKDNKLASFSNIGGELAAPGVSNYSTYINSSYAKLSGTSMASPHVAGSAALLMSICTDCTTTQIRETLRSSALDLGTEGNDIIFGYGLVNLVDAVNLIADVEQDTTEEEGDNDNTSENISDYQEANQGEEDEIQNQHQTAETRAELNITSPITSSGNRYVAKTDSDISLEFAVTPTDEYVTSYKIYINNEEVNDYNGSDNSYLIELDNLGNNQYSIMVEAILDNNNNLSDNFILDLTHLQKSGGSVKGISDFRSWILDLFNN